MNAHGKYSLPDELQFELSDFLANAWKHRYALVALVIVFTGAVTVGAMRLPKEYAATARLLIDPVLPHVLNEGSAVENLAEQSRQEKSFYTTQQKIISSRSVLQDTIQRLSLTNDASFIAATSLSKDPTQRTIEQVLSEMLSVELDSGSRIVNVRVESVDPELASTLANTVGQAYIDYTLERRLETTRSAARWLDEQVDTFAKRLERLESQLNDFKQANLLVSVSLEDRQNMISANLAMLNERIIQTRSELIKLQAQRDTISDYVTSNGAHATDVPPPLLNEEIVTSLRSELSVLRKTKAEQSSRYGELHPVMMGLNEQIRETQEALRTEIRGRMTNLTAEISALEEAERRFEDEMRKEKENALALNRLGLDYSKLTREVGTTHETYEALLKRRTETALSGLLESNFVSWFEKSSPPQTAIRPSVTLYTMLGFAAAILVSLTFVALLTILDSTIRNRAQLESLLDIPVLGSLPAVGSREQTGSLGDRDLFIFHNPKSTAAEAARSVRTNILLLTTDSPPSTLMVTSPRAQEGKTTTALSLAISMSQAGNRVLLIDTDLRRPRLHRALGTTSRTGLTTILLGESIAEAVKSTEIPNVDLLPCGPLPPNPAELLHSERVTELLQTLQSNYDRVIFDSPPVNYVADAAILSRLVDGVILVVRSNSTPREAARIAMRQLVDVGARIFGVVLNSSDSSPPYEDYRYTYTQDANDPKVDEAISQS